MIEILISLLISLIFASLWIRTYSTGDFTGFIIHSAICSGVAALIAYLLHLLLFDVIAVNFDFIGIDTISHWYDVFLIIFIVTCGLCLLINLIRTIALNILIKKESKDETDI